MLNLSHIWGAVAEFKQLHYQIGQTWCSHKVQWGTGGRLRLGQLRIGVFFCQIIIPTYLACFPVSHSHTPLWMLHFLAKWIDKIGWQMTAENSLFLLAPMEEAGPFKTGLLTANPEHGWDPDHQSHQILHQEEYKIRAAHLRHLERDNNLARCLFI